MKKKLVALLAAALMTVSFAGTAMAAFVQGDLIRVVYDSVGAKEYATDLGSWATITGATNGTVVGGGVDAFTLANTGAASLGNLYVGYYLIDATAGANQVAIAADITAASMTSGSRKFSGTNSALGGALTNYAANVISGTNSALLADKTAGNTFFVKAGNSVVGAGDYGSWVTAATNPGGVLNLAALATTGYLDQNIFTWAGANLAANNALTAAAPSFTVRTMADGTTVLGNGNAAAVPVPPAFFLMGSGLLGIFGVRRKMNV